MYSHRSLPLCLLACAWVVVASSSRFSQGVERWHETCGNCAATSSRLRRWYPHFQRKVSLHVVEKSDLGSCLQQRVTSHVRSTLHLLATFENLTLRHSDLNFQRLVSRHLMRWDSNFADWVLCVSPSDLMHSNSALLENLPQNAKPCSTSASTLPQFSLLLFFVAFFSTSLRGSLLTWRCWYWTYGEGYSIHHVSNSFLSVCLRVGLDFGFKIDSIEQPTSQAQLWSSGSQLQYREKCQASHQIEKISGLWKHNRCCIIQDRCSELES